ncbi:MAG: ferrochelatase [Rhabdochlamydiaceae bacterium]
MQKDIAYILVNFGGPRNIHEVPIFLKTLLCDQDVIRTGWPEWLHSLFFSYIAKKRVKKVSKGYLEIGGKSPIFEDTEKWAIALRDSSQVEVLTFHRYLPDTHAEFLKRLYELKVERFYVFPLFPQFTYATTGSIARWFDKHICDRLLHKFFWIKSYPTHPSYIKAVADSIRDFFHQKGLLFEDTLLLFSAHGLPQQFICTGDPYQKECEDSAKAIIEYLKVPIQWALTYQSQFGPKDWIKPYTSKTCENLKPSSLQKNIVIYPLSFTSDHIETLFEIEDEYLPILRENGWKAYRCPALNQNDQWKKSIREIILGGCYCANSMLMSDLKNRCPCQRNQKTFCIR